MKTRIIANDKIINVNPFNTPKTLNQLNGFLRANNGNSCFVRMYGEWFKVTRENTFKKVARTLSHLTFEEWLSISLNDNFISNI